MAPGAMREQGGRRPGSAPPAIGELDLHLFGEGTHRRLWEVLGAHPTRQGADGVKGVRFAVWAPRARRVSVVGDFCGWDGRRHPMRRVAGSGVFDLFVPGLEEGELYKYEIETASGALQLKADPFAFATQRTPDTASRVFASHHRWADADWLRERAVSDPRSEPVSVYEVHLGSWRRTPQGDRLDYDALADPLIAHALRYGFTHLELLPVMEHPFDGSWGYQVTGYFAPTARHGEPDGLRRLVDRCHAAGLGVILDWVPAHFPRDGFALRRFDGESLYEYADARIGEHPDWGTLVFDFGRNEVRNFLLASALFWLREYHFDALRVDAVASMLYRDYSRGAGAWLPNVHGGRENLEAVSFLQMLNTVIREECPGCFTVAEESTAWPGVTAPPEEGGLGFTFKWNLGWMHDTLGYFARDPVHRKYHQGQLTFSAVYEHSEHFLMPLSHDEVVHGKRSLLSQMSGDRWQRFANLRCLLAYQFTRPGKQLLFMGTELASEEEWNADGALDWQRADEPEPEAFGRFVAELGRLYRAHSCLWRGDAARDGFGWLDCADAEHSVFAYRRRSEDDELVVVLNLLPEPRSDYRIGFPRPGIWCERLCSDDAAYGGSGYPHPARLETEPVAAHGQPQSLVHVLPPLACLVLEREPDR
jgi:1,4-alpha-glucan branching enzyme